jgi:hypothetical protein
MTDIKKKKIPTRQVKTNFALDDLKTWLLTLHPAIKPTTHVNGKDYPACIISVDFGTPLEPFELTPEQATELPKKLKAATKQIYQKDITENDVRIWNDSLNGVWWTGVKHWS